MTEIFSAVTHCQIPPYRMAAAKTVSEYPEIEVIKFLEEWVAARGIDGKASRHFGFDIPVSDDQQAQGLRGYEYWIAVPENVEADEQVSIVDFPGGEYVTLRITDPFTDPFETIPAGWQKLVTYIRTQQIGCDRNPLGCCLEEVNEAAEPCYMDIYIRIYSSF
jgi:AraC family transcriptional regulator